MRVHFLTIDYIFIHRLTFYTNNYSSEHITRSLDYLPDQMRALHILVSWGSYSVVSS